MYYTLIMIDNDDGSSDCSEEVKGNNEIQGKGGK